MSAIAGSLGGIATLRIGIAGGCLVSGALADAGAA
jgi:hypothetical protein